MATTQQLAVTCLCGAARQEVNRPVDLPGEEGPVVIQLCHCADCRHSTGLLCASYVQISAPGSLAGLVAHVSGEPGAVKTTRYFCRTCGCHIFKCTQHDGPDGKTGHWEVATGVITGSSGGQTGGDESKREGKLPKTEHVRVDETVDGGLATWMLSRDDPSFIGDSHDEKVKSKSTHIEDPTAASATNSDVLPAECHCGNVKFHITRPDESSTRPRSQFPDLMLAYYLNSPVTPNPDNVKWWLRADATKYLAGTCSCRSCRLISGFEIQTWTFVPRHNIFFHVSSGHTNSEGVVGLDFEKLPRGILQGYESSPGVMREFCPVCGATVFWHDKWRPDVIDVSVGLLRAASGARAEGWLDWWMGRVSFIEDTEQDRTGWAAKWAMGLVQGLEDGLKSAKRSE